MRIERHLLSLVKWLVVIPLATLSLLTAFQMAVASENHPLLIDGKRTLYQRVLTRPGAVLVANPAEGMEGRAVTPFSVFYVYDRKYFGGLDWVEVGPRDQGPEVGWIEADKAIDWKQTITVAFTNTAGRERALLYGKRDNLFDLIESELVVTEAQRHREIALSGEIPSDFPVLSIEPAMPVDIQDQFYLLPILDAEEVYFSSGFTARLLRIASVTREERDRPDTLADPEIREQLTRAIPDTSESLRDLKTGVVFVIDTTTSMGPYIHRTREAVRRISGALQAKGLGDRLRFGLVAFRDNTDKIPSLDYVAKVFADFDAGSDHALFLEQVEGVTAAKVSSRGFIEDAYSGVVHAIENLDWSDYGGRYIVLITDAGARGSADPLGATGLGAAQVREMARLNKINLLTLHLMTKEGLANHGAARAQYTELSATEQGETLYYPVAAGDVDRFALTLDTLSAVLSKLIGSSAEGELVNLDEPPPVAEAATPAEADDLTRFAEAALQSGLAMQLEYLGQRDGAKAPTVFDAWIADRALENPDIAVLSVRLLMSKNQLSDLQDALKLVLEAGKLGKVSPQDFFSQLQSAAAAMSRDPSQVGRAEASNLAELGLMGEYLEDLPYRSKVMTIDQDLWLNWSVGEQQAFLDEVEAKINLYQKFHDDTDRWVVLDSGNTPGEAVYPVPLEALP